MPIPKVQMNFLKKIFSRNSRSAKNCGNFNYKQILGFTPRNAEYYEAAFTHKSLGRKDKFGNKVNYERLEYLGDAVLGAVIAAYLYRHAPLGNEGYLTQMRSKIVSRAQQKSASGGWYKVCFPQKTNAGCGFRRHYRSYDRSDISGQGVYDVSEIRT